MLTGGSIVLLILSYVLGSVPSSVWISKLFFGEDVRKLGSGNAGSTNMFRNFGLAAGLGTQLIDIGKGSLAASLPLLFSGITFFADSWIMSAGEQVAMLSCGICAVLGHIYPFLAGFKGGKGVNTLLGMMIVVHSPAAAFCLMVFITVLLLSKYVSLSSITATAAFPVFTLIEPNITGTELNWYFTGLGVLITALVIYTHRSNIKRLRNGDENKASFLSKKSL